MEIDLDNGTIGDNSKINVINVKLTQFVHL